ncbi:MAG: membrane protein insertion efficiency factor YidD [Candidatus Krumholzibacteriota bacterium]|nr:membrane protein insertion efficiency factor YidD [Candidatus Krumholzibacteriota bacterium]
MDFICAILISNLFLSAQVQNGPMNAPVDPLEDSGRIENCRRVTSDSGSTPAGLLFTGYQMLISPARGGRCPMYPSCSAYSRIALSEKGLIRGMVSTADRLLRCGNEPAYYDLILTPGGVSFYDPPR